MSRNIPLEEIPDSAIVPEGQYNAEVAVTETAATQQAGKLMYKVTFRVVDGDFAGMPIRDMFVIGSDDDPQAKENSTWKRMGGIRWKNFIKACQVPMLSAEDELLAALAKQRLTLLVGIENSEQYGQQNRVKRYLPFGQPVA